VTDFERLFATLASRQVEYILVGGMAAVVHGSSRLTQDLDVVYRRTDENLARVCEALAPFEPYPRGAPAGLPFRWDVKTLARGLNFTLTTTLGDVDLLGEITGGGGYERLVESTRELTIFGHAIRVLDLEKLIEVKRAAGRPKDFEAIAELEVILEERRSRE
jgi:hypothetical protein